MSRRAYSSKFKYLLSNVRRMPKKRAIFGDPPFQPSSSSLPIPVTPAVIPSPLPAGFSPSVYVYCACSYQKPKKDNNRKFNHKVKDLMKKMKTTPRDHEAFMFIFDQQKTELITTLPLRKVDQILRQIKDYQWPLTVVDLNVTNSRRIPPSNKSYLSQTFSGSDV
ncbi:hypothetical protein P9112_010015 [Eukaryota sp. TZLM1-RC]